MIFYGKKHDAEEYDAKIPCFSEVEPGKNTALLQCSKSHIDERPMDGIRQLFLQHVWNMGFRRVFEAESNENAIHFVGEQIRSIEGVNETLTMPATPLKEYSSNNGNSEM